MTIMIVVILLPVMAGVTVVIVVTTVTESTVVTVVIVVIVVTVVAVVTVVTEVLRPRRRLRVCDLVIKQSNFENNYFVQTLSLPVGYHLPSNQVSTMQLYARCPLGTEHRVHVRRRHHGLQDQVRASSWTQRVRARSCETLCM